MKKLLFGLIATVLFGFVGNAQVKMKGGDLIGTVSNGVFTITANVESILSDFNIMAKDKEIEVRYTKLEIRISSLSGEPILYGLFASTNDGLIKAALGLDLTRDVFSLRVNNNTGTIVCSSTNCGSGCFPHDNGTVWTCSSCPGGSCSKTMSVTIK